MILKRLHLRLGKKAMEKLMKPLKPPGKAAACAEGGYLEPFVLLEAPAHNPGCSCAIGLLDIPPRTPWTSSWYPWNIQPKGQRVSMTFNAASRLRSLEDRSAALGSSRCELPGMHSVPKSAVLPYASGVGGLSRRLLNPAWPSWSSADARLAKAMLYTG